MLVGRYATIYIVLYTSLLYSGWIHRVGLDGYSFGTYIAQPPPAQAPRRSEGLLLYDFVSLRTDCVLQLGLLVKSVFEGSRFFSFAIFSRDFLEIY